MAKKCQKIKENGNSYGDNDKNLPPTSVKILFSNYWQPFCLVEPVELFYVPSSTSVELVETIKKLKFFAKVPDLDGCITTGKTLEDAIDQITDAMNAWLVVAEDENIPIPEPTPQSKLLEEFAVLSLIKADTMQYRARTNTKTVRKNISLPAFLFDFADKRNINCSQVLKDALMEMF